MIIIGNTSLVLEEEQDRGERATYIVFYRKAGHKMRVHPVWGGTADEAIAECRARYPRHEVISISLTEGPL